MTVLAFIGMDLIQFIRCFCSYSVACLVYLAVFLWDVLRRKIILALVSSCFLRAPFFYVCVASVVVHRRARTTGWEWLQSMQCCAGILRMEHPGSSGAWARIGSQVAV